MIHRRLALEWVLVLVAASLLIGFAAAQSWTRPVDNRLYDLVSGRFPWAPDDRILILDIDDASLRQIGHWPWPREVHRKLLDTLAPAHPLAIGFDVLFLEPEQGDAALAAAMRRIGAVYLPVLVIRDRISIGSDELMLPVPALAAAARGVGITEVSPDEDGVVRQGDRSTEVNGRTVPQMVAMIARQAKSHVALQDREPFLIPFTRSDAFRSVPFASALNGEVPAELLRGKILLIGASAGGMGDIYPVPSSAGGLMAGVRIQANLLNSLLGGHRIQQLLTSWFVILSLLPTWLMLLAFLRLRPAANLRLAIAAIAGIVVLNLLLLSLAHIWVPPGAALLGVVLVYALWGWRRLAAMSQFLGQQAAALQADPGMIAPLVRREPITDPVAQEAVQLEDIIGQLRTLRQFTADVIERLPDATLVVDAGDGIMLANDAARQLFGGNLLERRFPDFLAHVREGAEDDGTTIRRPDGVILVMTVAPIAGGGRIVRLADVTDLQRATDEREEVLQFLSHDLRSPHAAILTVLEARAMDGGAPSMPSSLIERIQTHARHGLRLADDFVQLARARRRSIDPEPLDLSDVVREAIDMVWPKAVERSIAIEQGGGEQGGEQDELWVMGDHAMLLRATVNLLDNAVKFAPDHARVDIMITIEGDRARLTVTSPGPEMPPGRAQRPFALYAEGRDVGGRESIGLGLAFVQATAIRHGDAATYRYDAAIGSTFSITVPLAASEE